MNEKQVEQAIKRNIRAAPDSFVVKIHADGTQGRNTLDLVGAYKGVPFWVDVKTPDGGVSLVQRGLIRRCRACGFVSGAVSGWDAFKALFG